jgi:hypothetical protein
VTTKAWFFALSSTNTATFRAWGLDLSQSFSDVGLVKTADTGQIDWATVTQPAVNTAAGYEIWRYNDSLTFLKIEYGTGQNLTNTVGLWLTVGEGSNGSGTLTGAVSTRRLIMMDTTIASPGTSRQSFLVYKDGFVGFEGYRAAAGAPENPAAFFAVCRTTNAAGAPDARGATVYAWDGISAVPRVQALNFQTNATSTVNSTGDFVVIPMAITSSIIGADTQCFIHWTALPLVLPNPYMATVIAAEVPGGATFSTTLVGTAPRTYLALDSAIRGSSLGTAYRLAMLWE